MMRSPRLAFLLALIATVWATASAQEELPATDLNIGRYWFALSDQSPEFPELVKGLGSYRGANQFDQQDVYQRLLAQAEEAFAAGFAGNEFLVVNLALDLSNYDFERSGFALRPFDGNTFIPARPPYLNIGRERLSFGGADKYRLVFDNPEPFSFMDLPPDEARALLNGRISVRTNLRVVLQPISAQVDEVSTGYSNERTRTVIARIINAEVKNGDQLVWNRDAEVMDATMLADAAAQAGKVVEVTERNVRALWHRLQRTKPNFVLEASKSSAFRSANRFDQENVLQAEIIQAEQRFDDFIPRAELLGGRIRTQLSAYDANRGGFNVSLFSGASYLEGGLTFLNGDEHAFIPMSPTEADAFLDTFGRYPNVTVEFEAQPVMAQSVLKNLASLTPVPQLQGYLTKVNVTAESGGARKTLIDKTQPMLAATDIARLRDLPATIDKAVVFDSADIVLSWARAANQTADFDAWVKASRDYRQADNEFVRERLYPDLLAERENYLTSYTLQPWRVRIAARLSEYDFTNQRFEILNLAFGKNLTYSDGLTTDLFGNEGSRERAYELDLTNLESLQYFNIPQAEAEEILTQMGAGRSITLDMLVHPTKAIRKAPWGEDEKRILEALISDVRLLGKSNRYGGNISILYEKSLAPAPTSQIVADVAVDAKPHVDPLKADIKTLQLGMAKGEFENKARKIFGQIAPYKGQENVLRFENADGESGYGHFDTSGKLVFLQYYRTLPGRGLTDQVQKSVIQKYGTPFARDARNIGSHIKTTYLYFSDPQELGLGADDPKVGLWVEIEESNQLREITQLEINLGQRPS